MDDYGEQTRYVKRVVLPTGKTIEVVYTKSSERALPPGEASNAREHPAEPHQGLHVCVECSSDLAYPVRWEFADPENWSVVVRCPNCDLYRTGIFSQDTLDAFDEELARGADALARDYECLVGANMAEEIKRFVGALYADAILPEDF